jgi:hypothetical protein
VNLSPAEAACCAAAILRAYGLRGSTGFGGAVVMPLLALVIPMKVVVPVWTLRGFASSLAVLGRERRHIAAREFAVFIPSCLAGVAVGLCFFTKLGARNLARGLGVPVLLKQG